MHLSGRGEWWSLHFKERGKRTKDNCSFCFVGFCVWCFGFFLVMFFFRDSFSYSQLLYWRLVINLPKFLILRLVKLAVETAYSEWENRFSSCSLCAPHLYSFILTPCIRLGEGSSRNDTGQAELSEMCLREAEVKQMGITEL